METLYDRIKKMRETWPDSWVKVHARYDFNSGCEGNRLEMSGNPMDFLHVLGKEGLERFEIVCVETGSAMLVMYGCDVLVTVQKRRN